MEYQSGPLGTALMSLHFKDLPVGDLFLRAEETYNYG